MEERQGTLTQWVLRQLTEPQSGDTVVLAGEQAERSKELQAKLEENPHHTLGSWRTVTPEPQSKGQGWWLEEDIRNQA